MIDKLKSLLGSVPPKIFQVVIVVLNGSLIVLALVFLCYDISQAVKLNEGGYNSMEGTLTVTDLLVGVLGIVAVLTKKKGLIIACIVLMSASMLFNIVLCFSHTIAKEAFPLMYKSHMSRKVMVHYGNKTSRYDSRDFTLFIDDRHKTMGCCGWTGIDGENVFLKSPWYTQINSNWTTGGRPHTLPKSCCIKVSDECTRATNVKEARKSGAVYEQDCVDLFSSRVAVYHITIVVEYIIYILLQISSIIGQTLFMIVFADSTA